jgi:hypothetical protein
LNLGEIIYGLKIFNHPFEVKDLTELMKKVMNERVSKVSSKCSSELRNLV